MSFRQIQHDSPEYQAELALRHRVLRVPLGLDLFVEDLSAERDQWHYGWYVGDQLAACAIAIVKSPTHAKIRQMAVGPEYQGQGLGRRLLTAVEGDLQERGIATVELAARLEALGFYEKLGYHAVGEQFVEVGIPHQEMRKTL
ncbi:GNAT family N-acetyltransferase [Aeoliella sp. SH292]|uniref:GNAT family N-acetyltransferase n=1 Tax=Aeoliella sp. SH292 TaxID=3454464 RepID=UPI003F980E2D